MSNGIEDIMKTRLGNLHCRFHIDAKEKLKEISEQVGVKGYTDTIYWLMNNYQAGLIEEDKFTNKSKAQSAAT